MTQQKQLLIVANTPSENTKQLADAAIRGAQHPDIENVKTLFIPPLDTGVDDVLNADAILLGTTENFGYMSGELKTFFDRIYYPVLEQKQGLPYALYVRAGLDGSGTISAVNRIVKGLRWRAVQDPLLCHGSYDARFISEVEELGMLMSASLSAGIV